MAGRRIDDHHSWIGGRSKGSVFPEGVKTKNESSAEGFGKLNEYEDTTEKIKAQQEMNKKDVNSHGRKPMHRN